MTDHTPDHQPRAGERPLAAPAQDARGPSYDAAVERSQAAFAAARMALPHPAILDSVVDLAALVARLPPELPLVLDDTLRSAPDAPDSGAVLTVVAELVTVASTPATPVRDNDGDEHDVLEPALQLGLRALAAETPAPGEDACRTHRLHDRMEEALEDGEAGTYLTLVSETLAGIAANLETDLPQWLPGRPVPPELRANAQRLRGIADALAAYAPTVERLIDGRDEPMT